MISGLLRIVGNANFYECINIHPNTRVSTNPQDDDRPALSVTLNICHGAKAGEVSKLLQNLGHNTPAVFPEYRQFFYNNII